MSARDHLLIPGDARWDVEVDGILAEHAAEVLRKYADRLALNVRICGSVSVTNRVVQDLTNQADAADRRARQLLDEGTGS